MPRVEATEIIEVVRGAAWRLYGPRLHMEACGSYRRGANTCGDVDILFTSKRGLEGSQEESQDLNSEFEILSRLVAELGGFLTDHLKTGKDTRNEERSQNSSTYFGVCQLGPGRLHRRIDLKVYPFSEWPFALLSFTGSGPFNRSMRSYARRAGFSLSDHNIRPANHARGPGRGARIWTGPPIDSVDFREERDIFDFLGLAYREPCAREVDASWLSETATPSSATCGAATLGVELGSDGSAERLLQAGSPGAFASVDKNEHAAMELDSDSDNMCTEQPLESADDVEVIESC